MSTHVALSVLGKDRPGIVSAMTKVLFEEGCNIEDSSMTILRSEFAMILIVALGRNTSLPKLKGKLETACRRMKMTVSLRALSAAEGKVEAAPKERYIISVHGADKPGIVYKISSLLADKGINITDVQTSKSGEGTSSAYVMILETAFPSNLKADEVKSRLQEIADSLDVKIGINPVEIPQL